MAYDSSRELYSVEFEEIVHETAAAWLLRFDDDREVWLPKSQVELSIEDGGPGAVTAPGWLFDNNEINY